MKVTNKPVEPVMTKVLEISEEEFHKIVSESASEQLKHDEKIFDSVGADAFIQLAIFMYAEFAARITSKLFKEDKDETND